MSKLPPPPIQSSPQGFQLPTSHSVQLKPVRPPPQPTAQQLASNTSPREVGALPQSPSLNNNNNNNNTTPSSIRQSPSSSPNVARKVPPTPTNNGGPPTHPPPQPTVTMPPPPSFIKKLSPSSSPILPKRIVSSPPLNGNTAPPPPPIVHLPPQPSNLPPPPSNLPPPPITTLSPPSSSTTSPSSSALNLSGGMPPPPRILRNSDGNGNNNNINGLSNSGGIPPPPSFFNSNNNNNNNNNSGSFVNSASSNGSPSLQSQNSVGYFKPPPPPVPTRSASLDPKQMSQFIKPQNNSTNTNNTNTNNIILPPPPPNININNNNNNNNNSNNNNNNSFVPYTPLNNQTPPPIVSISPLKRNSIDNSVVNKRLSQDLNTMLVNRLQHGLSPPVATPFFDDKILGSASKSAELKEKRDQEERERRERERIKKDKEETEKKEKKEKKGKEEQEKKDKKKKEEQEKKDKKKKEEEEKKSKSKKSSSDNSVVNQNIFNNTLSQIMENQRDAQSLSPSLLPYPLILKLLTEGIMNLNGPYTEGIFRITGSGTEVNRLKKQINEHDFSLDTQDPHVLAGLLKLWLRELVHPIIPSELYNDAIKSRSKEEVSRIISMIPDQNKEVLNFLIPFLKNVSQPHYAQYSKMDLDNVAMVFSPGLLRSTVLTTDLLLNSQYEKDFVKCLIEMSP
ncbi:hypothetical protein ACTFIV_001521 [Dictyostelium citrinum]